MSASRMVLLTSTATQRAFEWFVDLDQYLEPQTSVPGARIGFEGIVGSSRALRSVLDQVRIVAPTDSTIDKMGTRVLSRETAPEAM
jgi:transcriptional regulator with GAF, ATPase, and Fis domain